MKNILNKLFNHHTLTREEAKNILVELAANKFNKSQMASFLTVFQLRTITLDELEGFRDAMQELALKIDLSDFNTIDLCGTGGDNKDTFNISTLASFIVAGAGYKVAKHGNYGVSSKCGSSNLIEYFGYEFSNDQDKIKKELDKAGISFLHAPLFHPAMKNIAPVRKEMGVKTFFNMLGPMVNPSSPNNQLIGVFNLELARFYHYLYQESDKSYVIVHNIDGYDEISLTSSFKTSDSHGERIFSPEELGFQKITADEIKGGESIDQSAEIFLNILNGKGSKAQNNVVIANAAFGISSIHPEKGLEECIEEAARSLFNKNALKAFNNLMN